MAGLTNSRRQYHEDKAIGVMFDTTTFSQTLGSVAGLLRNAHEPWWIIAGAAAAIHNASTAPLTDIDVLLSVADARRLLPPAGIEIGPGPASNQFRSIVFGRWEKCGLPVEFMAGFHHFENDRWVLVKPISRQAVSVGEATVFVPGIAELIAMCERFGRGKDLERARTLRSCIRNN